MPLKYRGSEDYKPLEFCVFADFETRGLGGEFLAYGAVGSDDDSVFIGEKLSDFMELCVSLDCDVYFHNLEYDGRYIVDYLISKDISFEIINRVNRLLILSVMGTKLRFIDTYALFQDSLKNVSKVFAPEYQKLSIDFDEMDFDISNKDHIDYLIMDCLALKHSYINIRRLIHETFGVNAGYTTSNTALRYWQTTLGKDDIFYTLSDEKDEFVRKAYHGGFVYVSKVDLFENITVLDFNSMYPSVMRDTPMPLGNPVFTDRFEGVGFYRVTVDDTEAKFKFLTGYDDKGRKGKLTGVFECYLCDLEYELALELGYKITVISGLVFPENKHIFGEFVDTCERLRLANNKNSVGTTTKYIQNSLYGKFGTKKEKEKIVYMSEINYDLTPYLNPHTGEHDGLYIDIHEKLSDFCLPHFSAYITAGARVKLVRTMIKAGLDNVVYCDTDSLFVTGAGYENLKGMLGNKYGELKIENVMSYVLIVAPKLYFGGKSSAKGFPKRFIPKIYQAYINGEIPNAEFTGVNSVRSILKENKPYTTKINRHIPPLPDEVRVKLLNMVN